jgi:outer membrane protein assembly factor BamB
MTWLLAASLGVGLTACASPDWPDYRSNVFRDGNQTTASDLSDASKVGSLSVRWTFPKTGSAGLFRSSPIVVNNRVFIGSQDGRFYALDAATGNQLWEFPPSNQQPLVGSCGAGGNFSFGRYGILSSAAYFDGLVIFGAPDPDPNTDGGLGSARLFAVNESTGALTWKSDVVAHVTGCNPGNGNELHERIAYSAPLVLGRTVYVGTHNSGDDPIQNGKVIAVSVDTGHLVPGFSYASTNARGGGVWNSIATDLGGLYFTTGNTCETGGCSEPSVDRGLSMLKLNPDTGAVIWQFRAVPNALDDDPDWAAGVSIMRTSCGNLATSVQKDGWTYALDAGNGSCRWQFPPTAPNCMFPPGGTHDHGDDDYKRPGAAWNDVLVITTGGEARPTHGEASVGTGYGRLHALNACAGDELNRVRWLSDVPHSTGGGYSLGAPTVTGGIVYVGTDLGYVIALADPSIKPAAGYRCSNPDFTLANCAAAGFAVVPSPVVLAQVQLPDASSAAGLRNEPVISGGRLFVSTEGGHVYMLDASSGGGGCPQNACGGCSTLYEPPGVGCSDIGSGKCGRWKCVGTDSVTCDTSEGLTNVCGGCNVMAIPGSGFGRGDSCICPNGAQEGILVCSRDKNHLICCSCNAAPGCGPGSP